MIRKAVLEDIPRIYELGKIMLDNFDKTYDLESEINNEFSMLYVYLDNDFIVGFISAIDLTKSVDIECLVVDSLYRRRKIASLLLDYLFDEVSPELKLITLEVSCDNENALALYEKFGFEIINIRKNYYKNKDAYLMGRVF